MERVGCMIEQRLFKQVKLRCLKLNNVIAEYLKCLIKKRFRNKKRYS